MTLEGAVAYLIALALPVWLVIEQGMSFWQSRKRQPKAESEGRRSGVPVAAAGAAQPSAVMAAFLPRRAAQSN